MTAQFQITPACDSKQKTC